MKMRRRMQWIVAACCAVSATALRADFPSIEMKGDYIWTAVSNAGTLGTGSSIEPGLVYDPSGTGTFDTNTDYITPGSPYEGFSIGYGDGYLHNNNQDYNSPAISPLSLDNLSGTGGYSNYVKWVGQSSEAYTVTHEYFYNARDRRIYVKTTITANSDLSGVKFLRTIDPDPDVNSGGDYDTQNNRGLGTIPASNYVEAYAPVSGRRIALYSKDKVPHNTMISSPWSEDPQTALNGTDDGDGDYTIGIGFDLGNMKSGETIVLNYQYIFVTGLIGGGDIDPGAAMRLTPMIPIHNVVGGINRYVVNELLGRGALTRHGAVVVKPAAAAPASGTNPLMLAANAADRTVSVWASAYGASVKDSPDQSGLPSYRVTGGGGMGGIEKNFEDVEGLLAGAAIGYARSNVDVNDGDSADVDSLLFGGYGNMNFDPYFVNAGLIGGVHWVDAKYGQRNSTADYDAWSVAMDVGGGADFAIEDWFVLTPEGGFTVGYYSQDSFSEDGSPVAYDSYDRWSYQSRIGGKVSRDFMINSEIASTVRGGIYWLHEFNDDTDNVDYTLSGAPGPGGVLAYNSEADVARVDIGLDSVIKNRVTASIGFVGDFSGNLQGYQGYVRLGYDF